MTEKPVVKIAPNNPIFDLPVLVGIEEGLFAKVGADGRGKTVVTTPAIGDTNQEC